MGKILTVFSLRKGSGKTTLAINIAKIFANRGRTLLIDLDPIGDSSKYFGIKAKYSIDSILNKEKDFPEVVHKCTTHNLFIIPSTPRLIKWENFIGNLNGLSSVLEYLSGKFENIIIDTSFQKSKLLELAVKSSHKIIVPLKVEQSSIYFLNKIISTLKTYNSDFMILPTMYKDENIEIYRVIIKDYSNLLIKLGSNGIKIDDGISSSFGFQQLAISQFFIS